MWSLVLLCLLPLAICQFNLGELIHFPDRIHGYSFEYHRREDLLLIRNSTTCFVVGHQNLEDKIDHKDSREKLEDELYAQIKADQGEAVYSIQDLRADYHDNRAVFECFRRDVYTLKYQST